MSELAYLYLKQKGLTSAEAAKILSGREAEEAAERSRKHDLICHSVGVVAVNPEDIVSPHSDSEAQEG